MTTIRILDPTSDGPGVVRAIAPRKGDLRGTRGGFRQQWANFDKFMAHIEQRLMQEYELPAIARVSGTFTERRDEKLEKWRVFKSQVEWAVVGLGACWGTSPWTVYDAIELEEKGIPTVSVVTDEFNGLAKATAAAEGWPGLKMVVVPHFFEELKEDAIVKLADAAYPKMVDALTKA